MDGHWWPAGVEGQVTSGGGVAAPTPGVLYASRYPPSPGPPHVRAPGLLQDHDCQGSCSREWPQLYCYQGRGEEICVLHLKVVVDKFDLFFPESFGMFKLVQVI